MEGAFRKGFLLLKEGETSGLPENTVFRKFSGEPPCLKDGTCRRPSIWWADGLKDPSKEEVTADNVGAGWEAPMDFLMEAWVKGWDEEILCVQSKLKAYLDDEKTLTSEKKVCMPGCSEEGMCEVCILGTVYHCVIKEHCSYDCTTLVETSRFRSRLQDIVKLIDLMKENNHHLTDSHPAVGHNCDKVERVFSYLRYSTLIRDNLD